MLKCGRGVTKRVHNIAFEISISNFTDPTDDISVNSDFTDHCSALLTAPLHTY